MSPLEIAVLASAAIAALIANTSVGVAAVIARWRADRLAADEPAPLTEGSALALVRPFRGADPDALRRHQTLLDQTYRPLEVILVCEQPDDPGVPAAREACQLAPGRARLVLATDAPPLMSGKVRNMIAGWRATEAPLVGFCDSDVALSPQDVAACVRELADPRVGAVSAHVVFQADGLLGRLGMLTTTADSCALLGAAARLGRGVVLQGGLMVFRRAALEAAGGLEPLGDTFADDARAGVLLRRGGWRIAVSRRPIQHRSPPEPAASWLARHHRWLVSRRRELPAAFAAELLLNATAAPAAAALLLAGGPAGALALGLLGASIAARTATTFYIDRVLLRRLGVRLGAWSLARPLADLLHFALCCGSLLIPLVVWRGRWFLVGPSGRIVRPLQRGAG